MRKSRVAQRMANAYPEWSRVRSDEQGLGHQLLNVFGNRIEDLDKQLFHQGRNYFLPTINLDEIDLVFVHELPGNFAFIVDNSDTANPIPASPTVTGDITGTWYNSAGLIGGPTVSVAIADNNDIESFWYDSIPTRISVAETTANTHIVLATTAISSAPITGPFNLPLVPGQLHITVSGGDTFIRSIRNEIIRGLVTLKGITRKGTEEEETIVFLLNDTKTTTKEWKELTEVRVYGVDPGTATVTVTSARFADGPYVDFYNLDHGLSGNKVDSFWDLGVTTAGTRTLDLVRFNTEDPRTLLLGFSAKSVMRQIELLDENGNTIVPVDIALQPFSDRFWLCTATKLYVYDFDLEFPNLRQAKKKQYDSFCVFEFDSNYKVLNDELNVSYRMVRPIKEVSRHRASVQKPDGSSFGILNGLLVPITSNFWVDGSYSIRELRPSDILTLDQRGDYLFTLEVEYLDGTKNFDQRVVIVDSKRALRSFSLVAFATGGVTAAGLDFDSDHRLWVLDSNGDKHRIDFATDVMLVDFDQKRIYFKEQYTAVSVTA